MPLSTGIKVVAGAAALVGIAGVAYAASQSSVSKTPTGQIPSILSLSASSTSINMGQSGAFAVTLLDQSNNPIPGYTVNLMGTGLNPTAMITNSQGMASWTLTFNSPGIFQIYSTAGTLKSETVSVTISSDTPAAFLSYPTPPGGFSAGGGPGQGPYTYTFQPNENIGPTAKATPSWSAMISTNNTFTPSAIFTTINIPIGGSNQGQQFFNDEPGYTVPASAIYPPGYSTSDTKLVTVYYVIVDTVNGYRSNGIHSVTLLKGQVWTST